MSRKINYLVDVMSNSQKIQFRVMTGVWFLVLVWFWSWWLKPEHLTTVWGLTISSIVLFWTTVLPGWYFFFANRMKRPNRALGMPRGRVAMVVTRAPSEPWEVARKTLEAMLCQKFLRPFDVWLADENPDQYPEIRPWCQANDVQISCRKGIEGYNNKKWPGREKSKEGNLCYFYDTYGYELYDFVVQMDVDHVPTPSYLANMIMPFVDSGVGYVAAPSICDTNRKQSWAAKARLSIEAFLHGPLQTGSNNKWAPFCFGSHYAVRTQALKEIGGLGPELAEDHSTTLLFNAARWKGVFAMEAEAHGEGPTSLANALVQEFQWSASVMRILLTLTPKVWWRLPWRLKVQFLFAQMWYPISSITMFCAYIIIPVIALVTDSPWVNINYPEFIVRMGVLTTFCISPFYWVKKQGWTRPSEVSVLSWEALVFQIVRWPWVILGCLQATISVVSRKELRFKVTPKGTGVNPLPLKVLLPYFFIIMIDAGAALLISEVGQAHGYYYFAILHSLTFLGILIFITRLHFLENLRERSFVLVSRSLTPYRTLLVATAILVIMASVVRGPSAFSGIVYGMNLSLPTNEEPPIPNIVEEPQELVFGAYDPEGTLNDTTLSIEEVFLAWRLNDTSETTAALQKIRQKGRMPLISLEPWSFNRNGMVKETLLTDIVEGKYDPTIQGICQTIGQENPQPVLLRWGQEMELTGQWEWAQGNPEGFIASYRKFVDICRSTGATNIRFIWSPAGDPSLKKYWPGSAYFDYVGLTALEFEAWSLQNGAQRGLTFEELFDPRYNLVKEYGKPVIIAEFGADREQQEEWLKEASLAFANYPLLKGVVLFNAKSETAWDGGLTPDWRINAPWDPNLETKTK